MSVLSHATTVVYAADLRAEFTDDSRPQMRVLVISDLLNYIEPCGCTIDVTLGGIDRLMGETQRLSNGIPTLTLVTGQTFFDPSQETVPKYQRDAKSELLLKFLSGSDSLWIPTPKSRAQNPTFFRKATTAGVKQIVDPEIISVGTRRIQLISLESQDDVTHLARTMKNGTGISLRIVISHLSRADTKRLAAMLPKADLFILATNASEKTRLSAIDKRWLVEAGDRGRHIGLLDFFNLQHNETPSYHPPMTRIPHNELFSSAPSPPEVELKVDDGPNMKFTLLPMDEKAQSSPQARGWLTQYTARLPELHRRHQRKAAIAVQAAESQFTGAEVCQDCHPDAYTFWQSTRHAQAWQTLEHKEKTFDAECVSCHVTGWHQPGGATIYSHVRLQNVQCEACHGPGRRHAESAMSSDLRPVGKQGNGCIACHNQHHSPKFSYPEYVRKVLGPGHGQPTSQKVQTDHDSKIN